MTLKRKSRPDLGRDTRHVGIAGVEDEECAGRGGHEIAVHGAADAAPLDENIGLVFSAPLPVSLNDDKTVALPVAAKRAPVDGQALGQGVARAHAH